MSLMRGRRPPVHTLRTMRAAIAFHAALDPLGAPPSVSSDYVTAVSKAVGAAGWGTYLNNQLGDCVCADSAHQVMLHTANAGQIVVPTDQDVLTMYEQVGGYVPGNPATDTGCDETAACEWLQKAGLAGQKSAGSGPVDPSRLDHIRWTVQIFGACRLGIIVDQRMEEQFSSKQPWEQPAAVNDPNAGGHDVPIVKYDAEYAYVVTWGGGSWPDGLQPVTWDLLGQSAFLEESHCEAWPDFCRAGGTAPNGFDLAGLLAQLPRVA